MQLPCGFVPSSTTHSAPFPICFLNVNGHRHLFCPALFGTILGFVGPALPSAAFIMTSIAMKGSRELRQGSGFFSPDFFNIYSEMILRNIKHHEGVRVGGNNINNLRYADDTVLIVDSEEKLQNILITVTVESGNKGLQPNAKKTECMVISKQSDIPVCNILCKGERIKQVDTFKYLGFTITPDARCDTEIKKRIALSKDTFTRMRSIFTNRNIKVYIKINTLKAYIWSILCMDVNAGH